MMKQRVENLPERIKTRIQKVSRTKEGLLSNAFTSSKWNSRIKSANTTKKEMKISSSLFTLDFIVFFLDFTLNFIAL